VLLSGCSRLLLISRSVSPRPSAPRRPEASRRRWTIGPCWNLSEADLRPELPGPTPGGRGPVSRLPAWGSGGGPVARYSAPSQPDAMVSKRPSLASNVPPCVLRSDRRTLAGYGKMDARGDVDCRIDSCCIRAGNTRKKRTYIDLRLV